VGANHLGIGTRKGRSFWPLYETVLPVEAVTGASSTTHDEMMFGRPDRLKVFVSSEMRSKALEHERLVVAEAAEETSAHFAWYWERDADAGPYSSERICLGHARTSDCLVLILADKLTDITRQEFYEAKQAGAAVFIFVRNGDTLDEDATTFLEAERPEAVYKRFQSASDLRTSVTRALMRHIVDSARRQQFARVSYGPSHLPATFGTEAAS
jgi:hypothetical protein